MKDAVPHPTIGVDDLRIGMYVHLDLGWMSHPFPLSSFRLATQEHIDSLRGLGLARVRWVPARSDARFDPSRPQGDSPDSPAGPETGDCAAPPPAAGSLDPRPSEDPQAAARRQRRAALLQQRQAVQLCERQLAEASSACRQAFDLVAAQPGQARAQTEALTRAFVEKMLGERDLCVRMLSESAGDKASLHALNVAIVSLLMGRVLGMGEDDMLDLGVGALLHDIGKAQLPERVRSRDEHFTPSELGYYQQHVAEGVSAGRRMGLRPGAMLVIGQHHEHADGSGFPLRLNSDRMTLGSRIVALVDRYDNLCNPAVPFKALTPHESLSLLFAQGKNKFDTAIMGAFIKMMGVYPPGSVVQLTDDRYAMVVAVNSSRPLKPRVLVYDPEVPRDEALLLDLEAYATLGIRRSLKPQQLPRPALDYLSPRQRVVYFFEPAREPESSEAFA